VPATFSLASLGVARYSAVSRPVPTATPVAARPRGRAGRGRGGGTGSRGRGGSGGGEGPARRRRCATLFRARAPAARRPPASGGASTRRARRAAPRAFGRERGPAAPRPARPLLEGLLSPPPRTRVDGRLVAARGGLHLLARLVQLLADGAARGADLLGRGRGEVERGGLAGRCMGGGGFWAATGAARQGCAAAGSSTRRRPAPPGRATLRASARDRQVDRQTHTHKHRQREERGRGGRAPRLAGGRADALLDALRGARQRAARPVLGVARRLARAVAGGVGGDRRLPRCAGARRKRGRGACTREQRRRGSATTGSAGAAPACAP
jgi:hypothetical protein